MNPHINIPTHISKLTGIQMKDVKDAPSIEEVSNDIYEFIGEQGERFYKSNCS